MNRYGPNVSPCRKPAPISMKSVSQSGELAFTFVLDRASLWLRQFLWGNHRLEVFALSSFCI